jgi:hypothetical protein
MILAVDLFFRSSKLNDIIGIILDFRTFTSYYKLYRSHKIRHATRLATSHNENNIFSEIREITLWASLKTMNHSMWNEQSKRLISVKDIQSAM